MSHHPPITAWVCKGTKNGADYKLYSNFSTKTSFNGKNLSFNQVHPIWLELPGPTPESERELYKIETPTLCAHNLILGDPYLDIGDKAIITRI